ncbi:MAG TPA: tyrosine-type recombinase/integrase [Solirubrobacteraceae bacterium]|nr:tyrosine-type recombinase/integrase [Solirubrobacteraceae bacterium]
MISGIQPPTGHVFRVQRARGPVWYAKYRLPDGRQVQKKIGPAWTERGRPPAGYFTKRLAEDWLRSVLDEARRGTLPGLVRTGATFADAAAEYLRYCAHDRACKPSTLRDYRSNLEAHLLPAFRETSLEDITAASIDRWRASLTGLSSRTKNKLLVVMHGVMRRAAQVWGLTANPVAGVEKQRTPSTGDLEVFSPEEVMALVRAAASKPDAAVFLTAAFTGLRRGELIALRWRDVDFAGSVIRVRGSYAAGALTSPKSGKVRSVPMAPDVARALAGLGQRADWTGDDDLVFPGEGGGYLDGSALRRRYTAALGRAGLRALRFHDLRHTFGTRMIAKADIRRVQEWMGHADIQTTMRYLHYAPRSEDAALVAEAFALPEPGRAQVRVDR